MGGGEAAGQAAHRVRRHVGAPFHLLGSERGDRVGQRSPVRERGAQPLGEDHARHPERERHLASGPDRHPFVGVGAGQREARLDGHERAAVLPGAHLGEGAHVPDRRAPGLEEVGAKRDQEMGAGEIQVGHGRLAEGAAVGLAQRHRGERLVGQARAAGPRGPGAAELLEGARLVAGEQGDALAVPARVPDPLAGALEGFVPGELAPRAVLPGHRSGDAVGIVEPLEPSLPARAQPAAVDGVRGIALDLDGATLARLDQDTAAGGALAARARVPVRDAGKDVLGRDQVRDELLRRTVTAAADRARRSDPGQLQEVAAVEDVGFAHRASQSPSGDTPRSPSWPDGPDRRASADDSSRTNPS